MANPVENQINARDRLYLGADDQQLSSQINKTVGDFLSATRSWERVAHTGLGAMGGATLGAGTGAAAGFGIGFASGGLASGPGMIIGGAAGGAIGGIAGGVGAWKRTTRFIRNRDDFARWRGEPIAGKIYDVFKSNVLSDTSFDEFRCPISHNIPILNSYPASHDDGCPKYFDANVLSEMFASGENAVACVTCRESYDITKFRIDIGKYKKVLQSLIEELGRECQRLKDRYPDEEKFQIIRGSLLVKKRDAEFGMSQTINSLREISVKDLEIKKAEMQPDRFFRAQFATFSLYCPAAG